MSATTLFGEHLKREREMRGVSLEEISAATRISVRFLEALENEQWERLPGGIFNRGFIRSVARFLGLDEDGLVAEYALETHERPEIAIWTKEPVRKRRNWFAIFGTIATLILLGAGGWYVHRAYGAQISAWHARHPIISTVMAKLRHKTNLPDVAAPAPETTSQQQAQSYPAAVAAANPNASDGTPATGGQTPHTTGQNASVAAAASAARGTVPSATEAPNTSDALVLKVEAGETSNVTVAADGKVVFSGQLDALKTLTLRAQRSFTVSASKSNAVLLELNGRTVPPLGPPNEPGKITLTRDNLKPNPGDGY
ncbi:MAG TPA: RodZ domain-containing protein [Candidatus Acidoferrales bacterium]|nr:RodZ domain-containing protein [Candidatus Acidoferrales bacterium]